MTRRIFIYVDYRGRKLYVSPQFNVDKTEYAQRGGTLDSSDLTSEELFWLFEVKTLPDFQRACAEAQRSYHSFLDVPGSPEKLLPVTEMDVSDLPQLHADELIFILEDGIQVTAPTDWDGRMESLYERVREVFHSIVSLTQSLNRIVTGQGHGFLDYCEGVMLSEAERDVIDGYLYATSEGQYQGDDNTITKSVIFPDGMSMDVKCCGSQDRRSWTEAVLFDQNGNEVASTDVFDEFEGTWDLKHNGILYTSIMKTEVKHDPSLPF